MRPWPLPAPTHMLVLWALCRCCCGCPVPVLASERPRCTLDGTRGLACLPAMHAWPAQECWRLVTEGVQQALKHTLLLFDAFYDVEAKVAGCMCCV